MRTYQEKCNSLKARAMQELSRLIRKYGVENECETDESTFLVFIGSDRPNFAGIDNVYTGLDYPLELILDPTQHANEEEFIVYPKDRDYEYYLACTDDFCALVDYLKQKYNETNNENK